MRSHLRGDKAIITALVESLPARVCVVCNMEMRHCCLLHDAAAALDYISPGDSRDSRAVVEGQTTVLPLGRAGGYR